MILNAQSPAGLAEEYLVNSIWNNRFPPGSILPSERELSELIGVTRTTLREVLQRLARDGWLKIRHGKPTIVNNIWETSGLSILETIAKIEKNTFPQLVDNLLAARQSIAPIFIVRAFEKSFQQADDLLAQAEELQDNVQDYANFDYLVFQQLAFASGNLVYGLMLNGVKGLYLKAGIEYFSVEEARQAALSFYRQLREIAHTQKFNQIASCVKQYGNVINHIRETLKNKMSNSGE